MKSKVEKNEMKFCDTKIKKKKKRKKRRVKKVINLTSEDNELSLTNDNGV